MEKKKRGRPLKKVSKEVIDQVNDVIELMSSGKARSANEACKMVGIAPSTFQKRIGADAQLCEQYARAREDLIENIAAETMAIADEQPSLLPNGAIDSASVQKQRLQVDTRKWLLSKLAPKKYGDKLELSGDAENPIKSDITVNFIKSSQD